MTARWADIPGPFLGNGSVNVPAATNQHSAMEVPFDAGCFYVFRVEEL
jgi:hypothetical protein